jgi:hypothetical protein
MKLRTLLAAENTLLLMVMSLSICFVICLALVEPKIILPMPPDGAAFEAHCKSCEICSKDDPNGGPGAICEVAFELLKDAFKGNANFHYHEVDGFHYTGKPIDGWEWNIGKQKWVAK